MCAFGPPMHALDSGPLGRIGLGWALGVDRMCQSGIGSGWVMMNETRPACHACSAVCTCARHPHVVVVTVTIAIDVVPWAMLHY